MHACACTEFCLTPETVRTVGGGVMKAIRYYTNTNHASLKNKAISGYILVTAVLPSPGTTCWWASGVNVI